MKKILFISILVFSLYGISVRAQVDPDPVVISFDRTLFLDDSSEVFIPALINFEYLPEGIDTLIVEYELVDNFSGTRSQKMVQKVGTTSDQNSEPFIMNFTGIKENSILRCELTTLNGEMLWVSWPYIPWAN